MLFRQLFDSQTFTFTYLLADKETGAAVLIDPVVECKDRDMRLLAELGLQLKFTLETHVHADHVTASGVLRASLGCQTVVSERAGADCADILVREGSVIQFGGEQLRVLETPGHTNGCVSFVHDESGRVFTGDALLIRGTGRTDFQDGDSARLYASIKKLFQLPAETTVLPGHDYRGFSESTIAEEREYNPRIARRSESEFIDIMSRLSLKKPARIAHAVQANMACGEETPSPWAPVEMRGSIPEVQVEWAAKHLSEIRVIDVREPEEFRGELGHVPSSELTPLSQLQRLSQSWDRSLPLVVVCRSGKRSGEAAGLLKESGFQHVASLRGGMQAWCSVGLSVER